jgi:DNA polymerase-2
MRVWLIDPDGRNHALLDYFAPAFYVDGPASGLRAVADRLRAQRAPVDLRLTDRVDLFRDHSIEVLEVKVRVAGQLPDVFKRASRAHPDLTYYDADIPLPQRYVLARQVFPLAYCAVEHEGGRIHSIEALDSPWEIEYRAPPLRVMTLRLDGELQNPTRGHRGDLMVDIDGQSFLLPRRRGRQLVLSMQYLLERYDPDVLISAYGDNYILPRLLRLSEHYSIPLSLNRDSAQPVQRKGAHSYFSYGRVLFRDEQHTLRGRWHIDRQNAFLSNYYGLDGILEIARISGLPVQTVARVSTGTGISAMQVATAQRRGVLVPWQKRHPESLKSGLDLLAADKGGLVYSPIAGLYEGVAELDFTAMYPSIMVHYNVSPETVEAECCEGELVPELGTRICRHRLGLVPETLGPLLEKRNRYKDLIRELPPGDSQRERYERRYSAHKWLLVTCFGYLGYKNARFGRIEAHEAVNAYGREVLLQAKELVEESGFRVLHLYVDGLWIHKLGYSQTELDALLARIQAQTGLRVGLEGIYRWLAFLPSRTEPRVAVANRYFGAYQDGSLKIRGIEARRHDTPTFIKDTQLEILAILAQAGDAQGFRDTVPQAVAYAQEKLDALRSGKVPLKDLVVSHRLSRQLEEYRVRTPAARVASQLRQAGVELSPGEIMHFIYVPGPEKVRPWEGSALRKSVSAGADRQPGEPRNDRMVYDEQVYRELLLRSLESVLAPVGVDRPTLETWLLGGAGYWGPPGSLPPPGADIHAPLLSHQPTPRHWIAAPPLRPRRIPLAADYKTPISMP